jgi:hypothetical protein
MGSIDANIARVSFENVNDGSCEGIDYLDQPAFSAQFHPEGCAGPLDTAFLFDRFADAMRHLGAGRAPTAAAGFEVSRSAASAADAVAGCAPMAAADTEVGRHAT